MDQRASTSTDIGSTESPTSASLPTGGHPLEVAARRGFGPLSPAAEDVWHGSATPCVTCGQLVSRSGDACEHCGQDLRPEMIEKMLAHAGPWYVLEHVRPFPGVSLERVVKQIHRGLIGETSIVRGPATDYQWRFAVETPGLCRYFGKCWQCHAEVQPGDTYCGHCMIYLSFEKPRVGGAISVAPGASAPTEPSPSPLAESSSGDTKPNARSTVPPPLVTQVRSESATPRGGPPNAADDLELLRAAIQTSPPRRTVDAAGDTVPRIGGIRATWIAIAMLVSVIAVLLVITQQRTERTPAASPTTQSVVSPDIPQTQP